MMFKKANISLALILVLVTLLSLPINAKAAVTSPTLSDYLNVIEEVNEEIGSDISVPNENLQMFFENVKNMSLSEFRNKITNQYLEIKKEQSKITINADNVINSISNPKTKAGTVDLMQIFPIYDGYIERIIADFKCYKDNSGKLYYERVTNYGIQVNTRKPYFSLEMFDYTISFDARRCTLDFGGTIMDPSGYILTSWIS